MIFEESHSFYLNENFLEIYKMLNNKNSFLLFMILICLSSQKYDINNFAKDLYEGVLGTDSPIVLLKENFNQNPQIMKNAEIQFLNFIQDLSELVKVLEPISKITPLQKNFLIDMVKSTSAQYEATKNKAIKDAAANLATFKANKVKFDADVDTKNNAFLTPQKTATQGAVPPKNSPVSLNLAIDATKKNDEFLYSYIYLLEYINDDEKYTNFVKDQGKLKSFAEKVLNLMNTDFMKIQIMGGIFKIQNHIQFSCKKCDGVLLMQEIQNFKSTIINLKSLFDNSFEKAVSGIIANSQAFIDSYVRIASFKSFETTKDLGHPIGNMIKALHR